MKVSTNLMREIRQTASGPHAARPAEIASWKHKITVLHSSVLRIPLYLAYLLQAVSGARSNLYRHICVIPGRPQVGFSTKVIKTV